MTAGNGRRISIGNKGVSDVLGCLPGGRLLAIEIKTPNGKVSPEQKEFLGKVNALGGLAFVARGIDDVVKNLQGALDHRFF